MNQRLANGVSYVLQGWIPIPPSRSFSDGTATFPAVTSSEVESEASPGAPFPSRRSLLQDPLLMLHVLKRHCEHAVAQEQLEVNPLEALESQTASPTYDTSPDFPSLARALSPHRLDAATEEQRITLSSSSTAAAASEAIGIRLDQTEGTPFVVACLRQLGHLLMAWNYPHVYARALSQTSSDLTLDQRLNQLLGFSPAMLALAIAERWRLTPIMRASIGDNVALEMLDPAAQAKAKALRKVCEAGEALARYLHPQHFPDAEQDWENASTFVKAELGASGLRVILSGVEQYLLRLGDRWPGGLPLPDQLSHVLSDAPPPARAERRNRYLTALTPALRENLEFVYQTLPYNGVSRDSLDTLLKRAIPLAGFERGIVYLFDPDSMRLVPRVGIGPVRVGSLNPIHPSAHTSGVAIALQSLVPHEGRRSEIDGSAVCSIAGSLGLEQRAGVLYLEAGSTLMSTPAQHRITIFKALRQTLTDILRLS